MIYRSNSTNVTSKIKYNMVLPDICNLEQIDTSQFTKPWIVSLVDQPISHIHYGNIL